MYNVAMGIPRPGRRRLLVLVAVAAGLLIGTVAVIHYAIPYKRHLEVQRQLAAFRADPSQENANPLARKLINDQVSLEETQEIIRSWLDLKALTKKSYRPGDPVHITLASRNKAVMWFPPPLREDHDAAEALARFSLFEYKMTLHIPGLTPEHGLLNSSSVQLGPSLDNKISEVEYLGSGFRHYEISPFLVIPLPGLYKGVVVFEGKAGTFTAAFPAQRAPGMLERAPHLSRP